ncbi:carbonic anhydrase [Sphingomonas koreensis]|jgi:carbonic anhydrase|uniref:Carbonic anhydrase n=1 Tax=Sphingomonas koreensis TaxID=93064 RepID=A0A1L6JC84_9SPHN|nr:carbonic anhydrase [Sphingomonas koreensis]APR53417.1 carbonate dehydratase [Sphingomonas koreensis]MDC7809893.1 carbonic anhydrase [Sphingomonas koreensis]RSU24458.1 carbonic anhydrase [Sphingomonas koreensis]RSU25103.1 carbonic anhydrase [Sphingomonas koreensis]RSU30222.1 carbonic anhydrase [Sphingomonas koreensis]
MTHFTDLVDGYRRFRSADYRRQRERWAQLAEAQSPKVMVIACSDSRVEPAQIFDTLPGEIFVVRNVANLVPPFENDGGRHGVSAALEFAVTRLNVEEIVVMGHGMCGGAHAALTEMFQDAAPGDGGFVHAWVSLLDGARDRVKAKYGTGPEASREMELETVRTSIANLRTFPFIPEREADGRLTVHGAYFAIADGVLHVMDESGSFAPA